ncbi:DUF305 domain-containing protein [Rhodococcus sp. Z13]|uniref:DUF305 domain-containing protein n=1 Tax=Rhodococcus sacchari TaxID=2962047 RepID=A0ACD4DJY5_9NOCA|nr:DUF305 domain-containing protein [Rhodococcus sp. Z13]UYP20332.1 DUF305 domain-containing protein [Rhodococcus sp. Z13]
MSENSGENSSDRSRSLLVLLAVAAVAVGFLAGFVARLPFEDSAPSTPAPDSVDVGFAQDMIVHHDQAVEMATIAITNSDDDRIRNIAYDILTTQQNQIGQMQGWLSLWDRALLPTGEHMVWMTESEDHGHGGHDATMGAEGASGSHLMPGMASAEDMADLRAARGPEFDVLFLQLMLRHHQGGLPMMEYGQQYASTTAVRDLAGTMVATQQSETELMTGLLAERGAEPLPMN